MLEREKNELIQAMQNYGNAKLNSNLATIMYHKGWFDCLVNERAMVLVADTDDYIKISYANGTVFAEWQRSDDENVS